LDVKSEIPVKGGNMKSSISRCIIALSMVGAPALDWAQDQSSTNDEGRNHRFHVTSTTFSDGGTLPLSMVFDQCPFYRGGGNQSPELSWTNTPPHTLSFIVVAYDVTASFTHWGMYNIAPTTTELPENAGLAGSTYGLQVHNDFGRNNLEYDGPCPPPQLNPPVHHYVFTVYALDSTPTLPSFEDFPPGAEALFQALIRAGRRGHILATASISGFFPGSD
jgi:Raf kinase inhibitor-like YbhB/YbcL family protein